MLGTAFDFLLVVLGFGLIIVIHELGHFFAAKWAGIRVLAFAVGMGPAILSFRKGLGVRLGSTSSEFDKLLREAGDAAGLSGVAAFRSRVSSTEYRLNILPFGGYVKMLGQEDGNPHAVSTSIDGFQQCKPWKRLIVISAGVFMNIITAAALFVIVFTLGMKVEPATVGAVSIGSPAANATLLGGPENGATPDDIGLQPGDRIVKVEGRVPNSFNDLVLATAMAERGSVLQLEVERAGGSGQMKLLTYLVSPTLSPVSGLLEMGVEPNRSSTVAKGLTETENEQLRKIFEAEGLGGVEPGAQLVSVDGQSVTDGTSLTVALRSGQGRPVSAEFRNVPSGQSITKVFTPKPRLQTGFVPRPAGAVAMVEHLMGLTGVMRVANTPLSDRAYKLGLREGDIFARINSVEYPSIPEGMAEVRANKSSTVQLTLLRRDPSLGSYVEVELPSVPVGADGRIGFSVADTSDINTLLALPPRVLIKPLTKEQTAPAAAGVFTVPGAEVVSINGELVSNFAEMRAALKRAAVIPANPAAEVANDKSASVFTVQWRRPSMGLPDKNAEIETTLWSISPADRTALLALGWDAPASAGLFEAEQIVLKAASPVQAISMGVAETRRVMLTTYVTFLRLFQGTVKVEHLKGPVGIAHLGTLVAGKGFIWLLFFLALISVNLAVVNFLPLPIVDGGHFLFILFEMLRGKPVPIAVQSAATMAGLAFLGCMFLIVTYNDIRNLLGF